VLMSDQIAGCKSSRSLGRDSGTETLEDTVVAKRSHFEHRLISLDLCAPFYQEKGARPSANEDGKAEQMEREIKVADIFGIYSVTARRINHVGLVKGVQEQYLIT